MHIRASQKGMTFEMFVLKLGIHFNLFVCLWCLKTLWKYDQVVWGLLNLSTCPQSIRMRSILGSFIC